MNNTIRALIFAVALTQKILFSSAAIKKQSFTDFETFKEDQFHLLSHEEQKKFTYNACLATIKKHLQENSHSSEEIKKFYTFLDTHVTFEALNSFQLPDGNTALLLAARYNCYALAQYLINKRKINNLHAVNNAGFSAFDYVRERGDETDYSPSKERWMVKDGQAVMLSKKPIIHNNKEFSSLLKATRAKSAVQYAAASI